MLKRVLDCTNFNIRQKVNSRFLISQLFVLVSFCYYCYIIKNIMITLLAVLISLLLAYYNKISTDTRDISTDNQQLYKSLDIFLHIIAKC
jgi:hypothetical protein